MAGKKRRRRHPGGAPSGMAADHPQASRQNGRPVQIKGQQLSLIHILFPDGDLPEESLDANGQTPSEGINTPASETGENGDNDQTQPEETTKASETDEYMDIDGGSGIPDAVPANTDETGE